MATFTVSIPKELKDAIEKYPEINLAEYIKSRFRVKIGELGVFEKSQNKRVA